MQHQQPDNVYYCPATGGRGISSVDIIDAYEKQMNECKWSSWEAFKACVCVRPLESRFEQNILEVIDAHVSNVFQILYV
jgi:hypothetical protein